MNRLRARLRASFLLLPAVLVAGALIALGTNPSSGQDRRAAGRPTAGVEAPTKAHAALHSLAGEWSAKVKIPASRGSQKQSFRARESNRICCGGLFLLTDLRSTSKKTPRGAHSILGFDPTRQRYLLTRADARKTSLARGLGSHDPATDSLTFTVGQSNDSGGITRTREVFAWEGTNRRTLTIYAADGEGEESILMSIRYRRRE